MYAIAVGRPREAARPLPAPTPTCDTKRTALGSSGTPATSPPHHVLLSPSVRLALRAASSSPCPVSPSLRRAWFPVQAAYAGQSLVTIRRTPHGAKDREATRSGPPSPLTDHHVRREAYRTSLFTHACDVASASRAAIAFREVGATRSVYFVRLSPPGSCNTRYEWLARPASRQQGLAKPLLIVRMCSWAIND